MKRFSLKTKLGERVNTLFASDMFEAQTMFAVRKKLGIMDLLQIFIVEEDGI